MILMTMLNIPDTMFRRNKKACILMPASQRRTTQGNATVTARRQMPLIIRESARWWLYLVGVGIPGASITTYAAGSPPLGVAIAVANVHALVMAADDKVEPLICAPRIGGS